MHVPVHLQCTVQQQVTGALCLRTLAGLGPHTFCGLVKPCNPLQEYFEANVHGIGLT